jgi:hypothetical protein
MKKTTLNPQDSQSLGRVWNPGLSEYDRIATHLTTVLGEVFKT